MGVKWYWKGKYRMGSECNWIAKRDRGGVRTVCKITIALSLHGQEWIQGPPQASPQSIPSRHSSRHFGVLWTWKIKGPWRLSFLFLVFYWLGIPKLMRIASIVRKSFIYLTSASMVFTICQALSQVVINSDPFIPHNSPRRRVIQVHNLLLAVLNFRSLWRKHNFFWKLVQTLW